MYGDVFCSKRVGQVHYRSSNDKQDARPNHRVIPEVVIPEAKMKSYQLAEKLFNNYTLEQTKPEHDFPDEEAEVQAFLDEVHKTPPMQVAREYVSTRTGKDITEDQWRAILERVWFEQFDQGRGRDLTGFEHVLVGEQKQGKVPEYHFWYKYFLNEHFRRDDKDDTETDLITFLKWKNLPGDLSPEVVTLSFEWRAFDYEKKVFRKLITPVRGFWMGPSVEGLMALGTVRFLQEALAPKQAVTNNVDYNLHLYRSPNGRNSRTFYPEFTSME